MPLVYQQNINADTKLGVWHIAETAAFFLEKVPLQKEITHPHKRLQHLAGRYILKDLFPDLPVELIKIADTKKPFLQDEAYHFSISHCGDHAAAIVSKSSRVGIDIEIPQQKIERIEHKFLNAAELDILLAPGTDKHLALTIGWSIKEALFKWYGSGQVNFRQHLHIEKIKIADGRFTAECLFLKDGRKELNASGKIFDGASLVWVIS